MKSLPIAIIGAGSWGTALALHLAKKGIDVGLWDKNEALTKHMREERKNNHYLPDFVLPANIHILDSLEIAVKTARDLIMAVPSHALESVLLTIQPYVRLSTRFIIVSKGIDPKTHHLLPMLVMKHFSKATPFVVLSGPSFALEVAAGLPTSVVVAGHPEEFCLEVQTLFQTPFFKVFVSMDYIGVCLGGAMKNVIAIAIGMSDGLGYGANMRAALLTHGMGEVVKLGLAMGAKLETLMGLSGMGDLVLTCTDSQSRNRRFGLALGEGYSLEAAEQQIGQSIEGKRNAYQIAYLASQYQVTLPIVSHVLKIVSEEITAETGLKQLLKTW